MEKNIVWGLVKRHPDNLQHAFRVAADIIDRTPSAISMSYYSNRPDTVNRKDPKRKVFGLFNFMSRIVNKIYPNDSAKVFFGYQVKNNIEKGKTSL